LGALAADGGDGIYGDIDNRIYFVVEASYLILAGAWACAIAATIWDIKKGIIPNKVTFPLFVLALLIGAKNGNWSDPLIYGAASFAVLLIFRKLFRGVGGGDVKLAAGLGALLGFPQILLAGALAFTIAPIFAGIARQHEIKMAPYMVGSSFVALWAL
jgi:leader peptidase (prepilin peptidase)/N-methyltransferase